MAPLARAGLDGHVPTAMMLDYYRQRAGAGLIITEATGISAQGLGWPYAPGVWTAEQIDGWKPVTAAVHGAGGRIFSPALAYGTACASQFARPRSTAIIIGNNHARSRPDL